MLFEVVLLLLVHSGAYGNQAVRLERSLSGCPEPCPEHSSCVAGFCVCDHDCYRVGTQCVPGHGGSAVSPVTKCPGNMIMTGYGTCDCAPGFVLKGDLCEVSCPVCPDHSFCFNGRCACRPGYKKDLTGHCISVRVPTIVHGGSTTIKTNHIVRTVRRRRRRRRRRGIRFGIRFRRRRRRRRRRYY